MVSLDKQRFHQALEKTLNGEITRDSIGTLGEKTTHAVLKAYFEPFEDSREVRIGRYVADIAGENGIIEIQTRQFNRLLKKLDLFLEYTDVTVVYPIPEKKYVRWIDPQTGELSGRRVSPKKGSIYDAFAELVKIKYALDNPHFHFIAVMLEAEDIRSLNGRSKDKKRGSTRYDRIPIDILEEYRFDCPQDYTMVIPPQLEGEYTSAGFAKAAKISRILAQSTLNILTYLGAVERIGKRGREIIYKNII